MRATQHFHCGLLTTQRKEKEFHRNTLKCFWSFFSQESKLTKGRKQKQEKLFTREISQQAKEESRNIFRFSFNTTTY